MMKQAKNNLIRQSNQNSSIAWFKLAELVNRGEKEKALNFYRLLAHSFHAKAYALQLEGDLLLLFEDDAAFKKYQQAAFLYKKEKNYSAAVAIYEHLMDVQPNNNNFLFSTLENYIKLDWVERFSEKLDLFLERIKTGVLSESEAISFLHELLNKIMGEEKERRLWVKSEIEKKRNNMSELVWKNIVKFLEKLS